jgi:hypothetical protein
MTVSPNYRDFTFPHRAAKGNNHNEDLPKSSEGTIKMQSIMK